MKDVLAQSQIDELLNDIIGGKVEIDNEKIKKAKKVKEYNFKIPRKLAKEQLRTIVGVYELYAKHLSSYLTGILRTYCQVEVVTIEETKYYEYSNAMQDSSLLGIMELNPFEGNVLMELSKELIFTIIDKLLGGSGNSGVMNRDYTDIEMVLMEKIYRNTTTYFKDAWASIADIDPVFIKLETGNRSSHIMNLDEVIVIIVLSVNIKGITGNMTVCIPYLWLEPISDKLYTKYRMTKRTRSDLGYDTTRQSILSQICKTDIDVTAVLGNSVIKMKDVLSMEVGDVIKLNQKPNDNVKININNKTWFYAQLGILNNKKAVEIVRPVE
ncbi:MAG: flagellar motor switch protein FliM [Oscillospiraceae bacterium]|nr:flagellar motor switch protein FliM [Oscillospiraceae bacterium]